MRSMPRDIVKDSIAEPLARKYEGKAVECHSLTRRFGKRAAVSDLEFSVPRGRVFGFLGPNGAGKTTTVRMMVGMLRPSAGSVRVLGLDPISEGGEVRARIGVVLDNVGLYDRLSALQNLHFAARIARLSSAEAASRIEKELHRVGLWDRRNDRVASFSKGMCQKLALARALITEPELLILDEPTAGLDPASIVMVRELLMSLAEESGRTIFLCTHLLAEAQRMCDSVGIIQRGRLVATGDPDRLGGGQAPPTFRLTLSGCDADELEHLTLPGNVHWSQLSTDKWRVTVADPDAIETVVAALVGARVGVRAVIPEHISLEEEYLRLLGGENDG